MANWNGRSPPIQEGNLLRKESRSQLRRLTVRRRHERAGSDRRMSERRRPASRLALVPRWLLPVAPGPAAALPFTA